MPHLYLPRVGAFPIFAEDHPITVAGASTELPLSIRKTFPLKDQQAPNFVLTDQQDRQCSLHDTIKLGRPIILFFFPLAGSPHCTKESCLFRDAIEVTPIFNILQAIVIGISQDSPERAKRFTDEHRLSYPILFDYKRKVMELYGVGRTTFGLLNNRATFIIDPSGTVRGLAEGVLNAKGHLAFAEKWLIKLEDELSERSKQYFEYVEKEGDMIARMDTANDKVLQVVYGDEGSASYGGLDGFPRYGGSSIVSPKQLNTSHSKRMLSLAQEKGGSENHMEEHGNDEPATPERNIWKNWKTFISQFSSPDGVPTPIIASRMRSTSDLSFQKEGERDSLNGRSRGLIWPNPNNPTRTLSRRRAKSPFGKRLPRNSEIPPPPVPQIASLETTNKEPKWVDPLDGDAEGIRAAAGWEADHSARNSISSTPPTSFSHARLGSQSSSQFSHLASNNPLVSVLANGSSNGHGRNQSKPAIMSEVLKADASISTTRKASIKLASPSSPERSTHIVDSRSNGVVTTLLPNIQHDTHDLQDTDARRSSGPSDVPEDADMEEDDIVTPTSLSSKPLPQLPSPPTVAKQLTVSASTSFQWAKGLGNRSFSSDGRSSPLPAKFRSTKTTSPPVASNPYTTATNSLDSAYVRGSLDLSSASRTKHTSYDASSNHPSAMQRSASALDHAAKSTSTSIERSLHGLLQHPFSSKRRSRAISLVEPKESERLPDPPKTPTMSSPARGVASSLVLESLSYNSNNNSQHNFSHLDAHNGSTNTFSSPRSTDTSKGRLIARKAPPSYPPAATQVSSNLPEESEWSTPRRAAAATISRSSLQEDNRTSQAFVNSYKTDSRRASAADSIVSTGTFG